MSNLDIGKEGERVAVDFLRAKGYKIVAQNYRTKLGEIDIIAQEQNTYCFIEVKTRNSQRFGLPQEAVSQFKQRQIIRSALLFLKDNRLMEARSRFDVVSIIYSQNSPKINLIKGAFDSYV